MDGCREGRRQWFCGEIDLVWWREKTLNDAGRMVVNLGLWLIASSITFWESVGVSGLALRFLCR